MAQMLLDHYVTEAHAAKDWSEVRRIMIDETSTKKGHLIRKRIPTHRVIHKSLDWMQPFQYAFYRYLIHNTGWFTGALPGSASLVFYPHASLTQVPPERLPRRAVRGLGVHNPHQTGPFLPSVFW